MNMPRFRINSNEDPSKMTYIVSLQTHELGDRHRV
jgi:hypothetical protein